VLELRLLPLPVMNEIQILDFDIEQLRARLSKMTDDQLREFGKAAQYMVTVGEFGEAAEGCVRGAVAGGKGRVEAKAVTRRDRQRKQ
jgi:hypothetical protein